MADALHKQITGKPDLYTTGGPVDAEDALYIKRSADKELLEACLAGEYIYVLDTRQIGKTSLKLKTELQLRQRKIRTVDISLNKVGVKVSAEQWYWGIIDIIIRDLSLDRGNARQWWDQYLDLSPVQRFVLFCSEVLVKEVTEPIVIFIDEIDSTRSLEFSDDFFAAIRELFNDRRKHKELKCLSFVLIGSATPNDLIKDRNRTPFNIGLGIRLEDFNPLDIEAFKEGLPQQDVDALLDRIFYWTDGHPYLTQKLCQRIASLEFVASDLNTQDLVDAIVTELFLDKTSLPDDNLDYVKDMLLDQKLSRVNVEDILNLYLDTLNGQKIKNNERSVIHNHLLLSGIVKVRAGFLTIRNKVYEHAFDEVWVSEHVRSEVDWWIKRFKHGHVRRHEHVPVAAPCIGAWRHCPLVQPNLQGPSYGHLLQVSVHMSQRDAQRRCAA